MAASSDVNVQVKNNFLKYTVAPDSWNHGHISWKWYGLMFGIGWSSISLPFNSYT